MELLRSKDCPDPSQGLPWRKHIVQLDMKPTNLLLDANMMPKIADFVMSSKPVGTIGYLAPEFYTSRQISFKSDIYSLGVIIIEITVNFTRECIKEKRLL